MSSWHDIIEKSCMFSRSHIRRCFCIRRILRVQFLKYAKIIFTESVNMPAGRVNAHPAGWTEKCAKIIFTETIPQDGR